MPPAAAAAAPNEVVENGIHPAAESKDSPISSFYAGRSVFITGATGFCGKVLVEKLLRSCPDVKTLYILCRVKKGQEPHERVDALLQTSFFDRAKKENPGCEKRVKAVAGDITEDGLGMSYDMRSELIANVSVIIHVAATIRFTERIKLATKMNIIAVQQIIALARALEECAAVVHTSTAYSHTYQKECTEDFNSVSHEPDELIKLLDCTSDDVADAATPALIKRHPNTYTFTKNCAEDVIRQGHVDGIPVSIVRPSIVTQTWREPYVGWTDTFAGPPGLLTAAGSGMMRIIPGAKNCKLDMVPVDTVANFLIVAGWHTYMRCRKSPDSKLYQLPSPIFNATSSSDNPSTCGSWVTAINASWHKYPMEARLARRPSLAIMNLEGSSAQDTWGWRVWVFKYWQMASHWFPGYLLDIAALASGQKAFSTGVYKKIGKIMSDYEFFLTNEWEWPNENCKRVQNVMTEHDRRKFNICLKTLHWPTYIEKMVLGIKQFKLDEGVDSRTVEDARKRLRNIALRGLATRLATGIVFVKMGQSLGLVKSGKTATQSVWIAIFIIAWYSRHFRAWLADV